MQPKFGKTAPVYAFTSENLSGYIPALEFLNKKILTVCGSGDHALNAIAYGVKEVVIFDINKYALWWAELKFKAVSILSYTEFKSFFLRQDEAHNPNANALQYATFKKCSTALNQGCLEFFENIYREFNYDGATLRQSKFFNNRYDSNELKLKSNIYLQSEVSFEIVKKNITAVKISSINCCIKDLSAQLNQQYFDLILLSNISDYTKLLFPSAECSLAAYTKEVLAPLMAYIAPNGVLCAAYVYADQSLDGDAACQHSHREIDDRCLRQKIFSDIALTYEEINFESVIPFKLDCVVLLKPGGNHDRF